MWFSSKKGLKCLGLATKHNLQENIRDIKVYIVFKILKVKVLIIFFSIKGFLVYKDKR
jgi:hypothetical protein